MQFVYSWLLGVFKALLCFCFKIFLKTGELILCLEGSCEQVFRWNSVDVLVKLFSMCNLHLNGLA